MALVPPVSRGNFHYDGNLYVEVGNLNRHKRATIEEITAVLRPDLKKPKKTSLDPPKDQVGHWYEAQLIHYGLPPSKDKARAKMRLLEALNFSRLNVPPNISVMESEMKKEYMSAERKARSQLKASQSSPAKGESAASSKKRKHSDPSGNVNKINVNINLGNGFQGFPGGYDAAANQSPAKKAKASAAKSTKKKNEESNPPKSAKKAIGPKETQRSPQAPNVDKLPRQTAKSKKLTAAWLKDPTIGPGPVNRAEVGYPLAPSGRPFQAEDHQPYNYSPISGAAEKKPVLKKESRVKQEPKIKAEPQVKKDTRVKKEPAANPSSKIKQEFQPEYTQASNLPSLGLINGIYDLDCPTVEREWSCTDLTLTLTLDGTSVWGAYDLEMFSGILWLPDRPWQSSDSPLPFLWRGRENGEGMMSFGDDCEGELYFSGNGMIHGWINVYGRCEFQGRRRHEAGTVVRTARSMREEWNGYNDGAYEEERIGRWR